MCVCVWQGVTYMYLYVYIHDRGGTGTLDGLVGSHTQTSDLSCPCNLLPKGFDPCFTQYQVQGDAGSDLPS